MYAKVAGSSLIKFPYTRGDLRKDNPNVSFPANIALDHAADYGVVTVTQNPDPSYNPTTQKLEQGVPVESGGWSVTRVVVNLTQEERDERKSKEDRQADIDALKADPQVLQLLKARPDQINGYIDSNVTDLATAKEVLKIYGRALAVLAHSVVN